MTDFKGIDLEIKAKDGDGGGTGSRMIDVEFDDE